MSISKKSKNIRYIVSACLIGKNCFYDGSSRYNPKIKELFDKGCAIAVCPEQLGGLKTPRPPAEIFAGSGEDVLKGKAYVFNKEGKEVTVNYIKGSKEFLNIAREYAVNKAILKSRSPCCGKGRIYDGTFTNRLRRGNGIATVLLLRNNIEVVSDEEFSRQKRHAKKQKSKKSKRG